MKTKHLVIIGALAAIAVWQRRAISGWWQILRGTRAVSAPSSFFTTPDSTFRDGLTGGVEAPILKP